MAKIDLSKVSVTDANEALRRHGSDREDVDILNPDAKHHIGVGLVDPITVRVHGSAGYFCAGLTDGPRFEVDNNVGWGAGDNMLGGSLVVRGNAGAIAGVAIRGAEIVVHGNIGSRAGQVMKAGTLCCAGNANFMAGYMMYGGRLIILGNSGEKVGQDMTGGTIYVGGKVQSLGTDATLIDLPGEEEDEIRAFPCRARNHPRLSCRRFGRARVFALGVVDAEGVAYGVLSSLGHFQDHRVGALRHDHRGRTLRRGVHNRPRS